MSLLIELLYLLCSSDVGVNVVHQQYTRGGSSHKSLPWFFKFPGFSSSRVVDSPVIPSMITTHHSYVYEPIEQITIGKP